MPARVLFSVGLVLECRVTKLHIIVEEVRATAEEFSVLPVPTGKGYL